MKNILFSIFLSTSLIGFSQMRCDSIKLLTHLERLVNTEKSRNAENIEVLDSIASYIFEEFKLHSNLVEYQTFTVWKSDYKNVICSFGPANAERIIIGAHYDVCESQPGADDNASGISGLLELARLFKGENLNYRIDLVAYTLEEPPYFGSDKMGSYKHAEYLSLNKVPVLGMISLEMIGFFSDEKNSQHYPIKWLKLFYGSKGDFITSVQTFNSGKFVKRFNRKMGKNDFIKHKKFTAPVSIGGVDFFDHRNYWNFGFSACMITDTAFMRNSNYHKKTDTIETLDLTRMTAVIDAIFDSIMKLNK
jgi:hypothetical protein